MIFASSEVVGYNSIPLENGFNLVALSFDNMDDTEGYKLSDLILEGGSGDETEQIQWLDNQGAVSVTYFWLTKTGSGEEDGWYDADWNPVGDTSVGPGQSVYLKTNKTGVNLLGKGIVSSNDTNVPLANGFNTVGNVTPVERDLQEILLKNGSGDETEQIQWLDKEGNVSATYFWLTEVGSGEKDGWYDADWKRLEGESKVSVPAGAGLYIKTNKSGVDFYVPSALK